MWRCIELAKKGRGSVAPNPMVGAVLVHNDRIIGEGYHQHYGQAHAEVNCIRSVKQEDESLIPQSTLYVSLEPCAHHGKTPPCADLIIEKKVRKVIVGCRDPFKEVDGKGIEKLNQAGIETIVGVLEEDCMKLNRRFFTFHLEHRPYIILKWAQTANGRISNADYSRVLITNAISNRLVHKWRSEESAILVGTNTALYDDPKLTVREWEGTNPIRLVIDMDLSLPKTLNIFDQRIRTIVFNAIKHEEQNNLTYYQVTTDVELVHQVVHALYQLKIQSVIVEGGAKLLQSFIDEGVWDEARIITNEELIVRDGIPAPVLDNGKLIEQENYFSDFIRYYGNPEFV
jgi:diaminohydroxyphosphoribosylaminopyrimidine deaminase/5-amino-6-(5-phosphoribosylamino)uracil reductase